MATVVGYLRVSTRSQSESGLGLEGQKAAIENYAKQIGANIVTYYTEVESGKLANRPELAKALAHCRRSKAKLVVAKLDRLARNVRFLSALLDSPVEFVACDNPSANRLTVHILAAVAEAEAKAISDRTKAALTAYKARGGKLGAELTQCRNLTAEAIAKGQKMGSEAMRRAAAEAYADIAPIIRERRAAGQTMQQIADHMTAEGHTTRTGKAWSAVQVLRVLERSGVKAEGKR